MAASGRRQGLDGRHVHGPGSMAMDERRTCQGEIAEVRAVSSPPQLEEAVGSVARIASPIPDEPLISLHPLVSAMTNKFLMSYV